MYEVFDAETPATATLDVLALNGLYNRFCTIETLASMADEISARQDDDERFAFSPFHTGGLHAAIQILATDGLNIIEDLNVTPLSKSQ